jgi:U3 small nucleolar RNA-associated protein 4
VVARVPGRKDFRLQTLVWATQPIHAGRLFGISLHGILFEVDLGSLSYKNLRHTTGGAAWCLSASPSESLLAVGCDDGMVRLFNYDFGVEYHKSFPSVNCRILSIAYHPKTTRLFAGCVDGTIRCFDTLANRSLFRMKGDSETKDKSAYILCLQVLSDSTVLSGDSQGNVQVRCTHYYMGLTHN